MQVKITIGHPILGKDDYINFRIRHIANEELYDHMQEVADYCQYHHNLKTSYTSEEKENRIRHVGVASDIDGQPVFTIEYILEIKDKFLEGDKVLHYSGYHISTVVDGKFYPSWGDAFAFGDMKGKIDEIIERGLKK